MPNGRNSGVEQIIYIVHIVAESHSLFIFERKGSGMEMKVLLQEEELFVTLVGSMYEKEAAEIKTVLNRYIEKGIVCQRLDFSAVDYIDSAGLGMLVTLQKRTAQRGGGLVISGLTGLVKELFVLTRVDRVFAVE